MNRQPGQLAQLGGKGLRFGSARAYFAGEMQRVADNDPRHPKSAAKPRERAQVFSSVGGPAAPPLKREHRLRRQAQLIGDGNADAAAADVQAKIARLTV